MPKIMVEILFTRTQDMSLEAEIDVPAAIAKKVEQGDEDALYVWLEENQTVWNVHTDLCVASEEDDFQEVSVL